MNKHPSSKSSILKLSGLVSILALFVACSPIQAKNEVEFPLDDTPVNDGGALSVASYADVLEPARTAVVSVTTASIVEIMRGQGRSPLEDFLRRYYGIPEDPNRDNRSQAEPEERRIPNGLGSGVIISADGYILTNNHVISDQRGDQVDEITVHLDDGTQVEAKLVGRDERTDVALLKIDREDLPHITMADSDKLRVGDIVFAIGNPLGVGQTSTMGIVSATGRTNLGLLGTQGYENFIQTDAAINSGNSGGALVDAKGRLIGINTAIFSRSGGNIGIGFAIPSKLARTVIMELIENGKVRRGYLGVSISDLNAELAEAFGLDDAKGALVETVQPDTPAARAGLRRGDIIRTIDDVAIESVADLRLKVAAMRPGTEITVHIMRDGEYEDVSLILGSLDDPTAVVSAEDSPLEGVGLEPLTDANREQWNLEEESGVLVTEVGPRSPYSQVLSEGMVILEVNDVEVNSIGDLNENLRTGRVNKLWISYLGNKGYIALRVRRE